MENAEPDRNDIPGGAGCPFCRLPAGRIIGENETAVAVRDAYPVTPLHTLIIPRRHVSSYFDLTGEEAADCQRLLARMRQEILSRDEQVDGFNVGINIGSAAGQTVMHCHVHLIPRRVGDVANARGGVRHVIPGKGCYPADPPAGGERSCGPGTRDEGSPQPPADAEGSPGE
jgi:diadenosine tetraphosphate (Ap4A) HIT family hydrolase